MNAAYRTLAAEGEAEIIINRSRFLSVARPVAAEEDALALIAEVKKRHPQANHNCYAYVIGSNMGVQRYSDDGEPQGTAGLPILDTLRKPCIVNACVVVTRYFGGVLLGAGGLVRAYTTSAAAAVDNARVALMEPTAQLAVVVEYPLLPRLTRAIESLPVQVISRDFASDVTLTLLVRLRDLDSVTASITQAVDGRCEAVVLEETFCAWAEE